MSVLLCHVPEEDTVSKRILSEIYSARHREMWNAIPSVALRGSKTTFDKQIGKYDAVFSNGEKISQFLSIYTLGNDKKACIQMQFDISDERFKLLNFEQYSQRISDIIKVNMQKYPDGRIDIGFLPDTAYQKSLAHPSSDSPPQPPQKHHATVSDIMEAQNRLAETEAKLKAKKAQLLQQMCDYEEYKNRLLAKKTKTGLTAQEEESLKKAIQWIRNVEDILSSI